MQVPFINHLSREQMQEFRINFLAPQAKLIIVPCKIPCPLSPRIVDHPGYAGSLRFIERQHTILEFSLSGRQHFEIITAA